MFYKVRVCCFFLKSNLTHCVCINCTSIYQFSHPLQRICCHMNSMPCWGWVTGDKSAGCPGCQKDQPQPGVPPAQHCLTLHCTGGALSTGGSLGCSVQEGHQTVTVLWSHLCDQNCRRSQGQNLWGAAEDIWLVQFGGKRAEGCPHHSLQLPPGEEEEVLIPLWWPATGHEEIEWSCIEGSSGWTPGKGSSLTEWLVTGPVTQGSGQGTKPVRVWASPGFHS